MDDNNSKKQKPKVRVERRRRPGAGTASERPRAEAPQRREQRSAPSSGATPPTSGGTQYPAGGGGQIPIESFLPLLKRLPWWAVLLIGCVFLGFLFFSMTGGDDTLEDVGFIQATEPEYSVQPTTQPAVLATSRPTRAPLVSGPSGDNTWLVMLYQDADDKILEQDIFLDLNEAERVGSSDNMHIVAQLDRFSGGFQGDGNWTNARRLYITQDDDLNQINSEVVQDMAEVNMGEASTLVDFVTWAVENYPANHYVLILSDHGMGWPGGWSDSVPAGSIDASIPLQKIIGPQLYLNELDQALEEIRALTGIEYFDLIGMDACLMGHLEVFTALAPHAHFAVASQETEPAVGWAYTGFLSVLKDNPGIDGAALGQLIVESYIQDDQRIVDDRARAEFLQQNSPMGGLFGFLGTMSASQVTQQLEQNITLTAVDLSELPGLQTSLNNLAYMLQSADQKHVAQARSYAQSYTNVFGKDVPPAYIDLGHFAQLLAQYRTTAEVLQASQEVRAAINQFVVAEKHGPKVPGSTGVSIYFPNAQLYGNAAAGAESYTAIAERFATQSLWDEYLAYHYSGRKFELQSAGVVSVAPSGITRAPGAGQIEISAISLSDSETAPGNPVLVSADISGENIGYVKLFVGFLDSNSNSIFVADMDYLESADTRVVDGVYYPVWPEEAFTLEYAWDPVVFAINDGVNSVVALFKPESYGASFEEAVYTVDGKYTFVDEGQTVYARLYFSNGLLRNVYGFTGEDGVGAPREIIPNNGDKFTVLDRWLDLDASGKVVEVVNLDGDELIFGENMFVWEERYAAAGEYIVGLVVEDLEGNAYQSLEQVLVR
jgi:hypothetical protein